LSAGCARPAQASNNDIDKEPRYDPDDVWKSPPPPCVTFARRYGGLRRRAHVMIAIHYALPAKAPTRWLGMLFGPLYARWCVQQMAQDLVHQFAAYESSVGSNRSHQ
jgi:hypothetical protein